MAGLFDISVIGPDAVLYKGKISSLAARFGNGSAEILAGHAPFAALTEAGSLKLRDDQGRTTSFDIPAGSFFLILDGRAALLLPADFAGTVLNYK
jgi:F0F1-type ATP synthase epsilon subunit